MFSKTEKVNFLNSIVTNIQRESQKNFILADVVEEFAKESSPSSTFYGIRYYYNNGKGAIRFNYSNSDSYDNVHSIDVWTSENSQPAYSVITDEMGLVKAVDAVKNILRGLKQEAVQSADADISSPAQKKVDQQVFVKTKQRTAEEVDQLFDDAFDFAKAVSNGHINSLVLTGTAGVGKSHVIEEALKGTSYVMRKGHTSPMGLYMTLHDNPESVVVYDDADSVFDEQRSTNILKAVLDTKKDRIVSWDSSALPEGYDRTFVFEGGIIFISNLPADFIDKKTQGALRSRSVVVEFDLTPNEVLGRIERLLDKISPNVSMEVKREVFEAIKKYSEEVGKSITTRALVIGIGLRQAFPDKWRTKMRYVN